jgi:hypothetical protein
VEILAARQLRLGRIGPSGLVGLMVLIGVFAFSGGTVSASGLVQPPNNLGLVGYWSFEDNGGLKATDFSGKGNTGTLTNMEVSDWVDGKRGKALDFDGSNEHISIPDANSLDFTTTMTLSTWVKFDDLTGYHSLFERWGDVANGNSVWLFTDSTSLYIRLGTAYGFYGPFSTGTWYHLTAVYDGSQTGDANRLKLYVNGSAVTLSYTGAAVAASLVSSADPLYLGAHQGSSLFLNGIMDEARAYNRALSATEVNTLYQQSSKKIGVGSLVSSGLLAYWPMDIKDIISATSTDRSGNSKDGTISGTVTVTGGQSGQALNFNGSTNYVTAPNVSTPTAITVSAWVYSTNFGGNMFVVQKAVVNQQWQLFFEGGSRLYWGTNHDIFCDKPSDSAWHHIVATQSGTAGKIYIDGVECTSGTVTAIGQGSGLIWIGAHDVGPGYLFNGKIDEVRVYNRALSATEIKVLYQGGGVKVSTSNNTIAPSSLVGWWTFDGGDLTNSSASSTDRSGQGSNGSLRGSSGSQSKPQPVIGKIGQALRFDGTDDYVTIPSGSGVSADGVTFSAWIKPSSISTGGSIIWNHYGGDKYFGVIINLNGNGSIGLEGGWCGVETAAGALTLNQWQHVVVAKDPGEIVATTRIYVNGVLQSVSAGPYGTCTPTYNAFTSGSIGIGWGDLATYPFPGLIDDVRLYNKPLTAAEVLALYNQGK